MYKSTLIPEQDVQQISIAMPYAAQCVFQFRGGIFYACGNVKRDRMAAPQY